MTNQLRVLVIERDANKVHRINTVLKEACYEVLTAESFADAMQALQVQRFDAVLVGSALNPQAQAEFTAGLRNIERSLGFFSKTPVLQCSSNLLGNGWRATQEQAVDAYLPEEFVAATFTDAVLRLAQAVSPNVQVPKQPGGDAFPVFEPDKFRAQVAYDKDLLVEIIDLFLAERVVQVQEMRAALQGSDFARLSRVAHTIKGSLASLHAAQARARAQELEFAAKSADAQLCRFSLASLEQDLNSLEPQLIALRNSAVH